MLYLKWVINKTIYAIAMNYKLTESATWSKFELAAEVVQDWPWLDRVNESNYLQNRIHKCDKVIPKPWWRRNCLEKTILTAEDWLKYIIKIIV